MGSDLHVLRRDPDATDDETLGFKIGDIVLNAVTGKTWWWENVGSGWILLPDPT